MPGWEIAQEPAFRLADYPSAENCPCNLRFLSDRSIDIILSALRFAHWAKLWEDVESEDHPNWPTVEEMIGQVEHELMSECANVIADAIDNLSTQLHSDLQEIKAALPGDQSTALEAIADNVGLDTQAVGELEDDLANVWFTMKSVATILGAVVGEPPLPL